MVLDLAHFTKQPLERFLCGYKVFNFKTTLILRENASSEGYMSPIVYILKRNEKSHNTENHCGYLIRLDLPKSLFVKPI